MAEGSVFRARADGRYEPTGLARGPWDPMALHGGAPAALLAEAFEHHDPQDGLQVARLGFEFLKPIPMAPLSIAVRTVRDGRRVQELAAELHAGLEGGEQLIARASALRLSDIPAGLPASAAGVSEDAYRTMPGFEQGQPFAFALNEELEVESFGGTAMEMRWLNDPWRPGPGRTWMRLGPPLVDDRPASPLARLGATADFGNGVSAALPFEDWLFINADLHIHLLRMPRGEWIGIDAHTHLHEGGTALAESVLHDAEGPVGRAFQALVVAPR